MIMAWPLAIAPVGAVSLDFGAKKTVGARRHSFILSWVVCDDD